MVKVLVLDEDSVRRATLVDLLAGLGHDVRGMARANDVLDAHHSRAADLVVASGSFGGLAGLDLALRLQKTPRPAAVVLITGPHDAGVEQLARTREVPLRGCLSWPADAGALAALVSPLGPSRPLAPVQEWSGAAFLESLRGPAEAFPLPRVLFLAHRVDAVGAVVWAGPGGTVRVHVKSARVVQVEGVSGLFDALDTVDPDPCDLFVGLGSALRAGAPFPAVMEAVTGSVAAWLIESAALRGGEVWFDAIARPPSGAVAIPVLIPRLLAMGLAQSRTDAALAREWGARGHSPLAVRLPDDSPESRWGLDATALRLLKVAHGILDVDQLLATTAGRAQEDRGPALRALELLTLLGLVRVEAGAPITEEVALPAPGPPVAPAPPPDPHEARLRSALAAMQGAHPMDLLGLADRPATTEADISSAYRKVSRWFHPDTVFQSSAVVRGLAEACFSAVNGAYESLMAPGGLPDAQRFLALRKAGRGVVSEREHQASRVAFKRAELLFRNRDWKGADVLYLEAERLDSSTWPHAFHALRCGALSRRLPLKEAVAKLDALPVPSSARRAEVLVVIGNLHKLEGQQREALQRYRQALEADAANHDAQRELRLHQSRAVREPDSVAPPRTAASAIASLFRRSSDPK